MNRIKVLGALVLAVFAVSAVSAAAAQAGEFHSTIQNTFLFGEQEGENVFKTTAGNVKCKKMTLDSLVAQVAESGSGSKWNTKMVNVQAQRKECTAFGSAATVENPPAGAPPCDEVYTANPDSVTKTGTPIPATGQPDSHCITKIVVSSGNCNVKVEEQTPGTPTVTYANTTFEGIGAVKVTSGVEGVKYTVEGAKGSICGEPGSYTNGKYEGKIIMRGYKSGTHTKAEQVAIEFS
jgi:hypothetical protein